MSGPSPTLRQVAEAAGVHHTTLSRALRHHPEIAAAKAEYLREFARKMGYVPDPMLRALAAYRGGRRPMAFHSVIAWLNPSSEAASWQCHRTYREYFACASDRAQKLGFKLEEITVAPSGDALARVTSMLRARSIHAAIVVPAPVSQTSLEDIDWEHLSAVRIGHSLSKPRLHAITSNHHGGMLKVMAELRARGYRRPGLCISKRMDIRVNYHWSAAFFREQNELPTDTRVPPLLFDAFTHESFCTWIDRYAPDAIIAVGDDLIPDSIRKSGLRVPEDIGLVALVQPEHADVITGIVGNRNAVGAVAVDVVVAMINRQERGIPEFPHTLLIDDTWIDCGTLRPRAVETVD
ncbi:LacI family DNA-binding transcriptional regulator [Coraliomargarita sp. SDUM461004]|uniref:LacI family DNA-binding transcriptional regulator n=1 Tax=Thalassobacterium sedimentorum TaxID=3041258 RepID=A0ABU1AIX6_9BACT|nr:LacI family DNA-binding transcriptional regulator [Coraliomargarita sp. SDUM461004]MDQ8194647.1 LacI family DNA-binding transcriptional regulator [Coraliomargarita sp. SDUM461004]